MEVQVTQLIIGCIAVFVLGFVIFSLAFEAYYESVKIRERAWSVNSTEVRVVSGVLSVAPVLLVGGYVGAVIFVGLYILHKKKMKRNQESVIEQNQEYV